MPVVQKLGPLSITSTCSAICRSHFSTLNFLYIQICLQSFWPQTWIMNFKVQAHGSDAMVDEENCVFFLPHRPRSEICEVPFFLFMKGTGNGRAICLLSFWFSFLAKSPKLLLTFCLPFPVANYTNITISRLVWRGSWPLWASDRPLFFIRFAGESGSCTLSEVSSQSCNFVA